jgi:DNA mismatch repair ATPase MutS
MSVLLHLLLRPHLFLCTTTSFLFLNLQLAETAAALRGATRRSLVIMDELGRGTSTFDGTAIASASVKHLVERTKCLTLFATHYHSLLDDWKDHQGVRLGHMECVVENGQITTRTGEVANEGNVTFLYTLGEGGCPKSFGINVARLAGLPFEVLSNAQRISAEFERETNGNETSGPTGIVIAASKAADIKKRIDAAVSRDDNWDAIVFDTCKELQTEMKSI